MQLIDQYLPEYHFNEFHSIRFRTVVPHLYEKMLNTEIPTSFLANLLFRLRGVSTKSRKITEITSLGFVLLNEIKGEEVLFGTITKSWRFNSCYSNFSNNDFKLNTNGDEIKAVINFRTTSVGGFSEITTETRVYCENNNLKRKFGFYWFFINPFSRFIRWSILKSLRRQLES